MNGEQDLRAVVREFKASVSAELVGMFRRLEHMSDDVRGRFRTLETAVMNELRDLSRRADQRADRIEGRLEGLDLRFDRLAASLARIEDTLGGEHPS